MDVWDKGGVVVTAVGAEIGPPLLRVLHDQVDELGWPAPAEEPLPPLEPGPVVDLTVVVALLTDIHQELVGVRTDLQRRTLAGRIRRAWAWICGWFR